MNRKLELEDWCMLALATGLSLPLAFAIICAIWGIGGGTGLETVEHDGHKFIKSASALIHHPDCKGGSP
jgi:hypothetical protein